MVLGSALMLLLPVSSHADKAVPLAEELQSTLSQIEMIQDRISRLESLRDSLSAQQASYAGYGFARPSGDLERVRNALYEAKAQRGRLVARKVYLQHRIQVEGALEPGETAYTSETVEDKPTQAPENCSLGAVNVRGKWHCLKRQTRYTPRPEKKTEKCELGTVDLHGKSYCLGKEPGGPLVQEASSNFLGVLLNND